MNALSNAPSGQQWRIQYGDYEAVVVEVGGALRELTFRGEPIVAGYPQDAMADAARGNLLVPWPNRIRDGKYSYGGKDFQLPLTEPGRLNASHGLGRWANWELVRTTAVDSSTADDQGSNTGAASDSHDASELVVGLTIHPCTGWAWTVRVEVTYRLDADGLTVTPRATNLSASPCPFGFGAHPYLTTGERDLDETVCTTNVSQEITVDDRLLPTGVRPAEHDFSDGLCLAGVNLDVCYTDPQPDENSRWTVTLSRGERRVSLWAHAAYGYLQLFTGDGLPTDKRRKGLAVEPMTCPANAFNSGDGLIDLEPGQTWSAPFGIRAQ